MISKNGCLDNCAACCCHDITVGMSDIQMEAFKAEGAVLIPILHGLFTRIEGRCPFVERE